MSIKSKIRKMLFLSLGIVLGAGLLLLLIAAINKKNHKNCSGVEVTINSTGDYLFLDRQDVMAIIAPDKNNPSRGKALASFDLKKLESALKQNVWVRDAELFFDNNGQLQVNIREREPIARIFTTTGNSFYIDSSGKHLPLSDKITIRLPVYSNFPADKAVLHGADSALLQQIKQMSRFIRNDSFWMAQLAQIDITADNTFEMIPVIGNHTIVFGDGNNYQQKFHRLLLFYQQVASKTGFDKYSIINIQYERQVIGTKKGTTGRIDSLQALKNIQKLIEASHKVPADTVSTMVDNNIVVNPAPEPSLTLLREQQKKEAINNSSSAVPTSASPSSMKNHPPFPLKQTEKTFTTHEKPKAVMKKTNSVPKL
jgi:cell division protein FtsQ